MASVKRSTTWLTLVCLAIAPAAVRADGPDAGAADSSAALAAEIETEVPFDRAGRVTRLDAPLARALGMLETHPGFQEARLLARADSTFVLETTSLDRGHLIRQRQRMSAAEVDALRVRVDQALQSGVPATADEDGRPLFITTSTIMGLAFYGWAVPVLADAGGETFAGLYMVTAGASTVLPMVLTRGEPITNGAAILWTYGVTRGTLHGALAPYLETENPDGHTQLACALGLSLAEGTAGFVWGQASHMRTGTAGTLVTGGDFGMLYGAGIADLANSTKASSTAGLLIGTAVGMAGASVLDRHRDYSYGDGAVMRMAGWVGAYAGLAAANLGGGPLDHDTGVACAMAGGLAGLAIGDRMVAGTEFSFGQSVVVDFSTVAFGLMGLGVGLIVQPGNSSDDRDQVLTTCSSLGSVLGLAVGYSMEYPRARDANAGHSTWRLELTPTPPLARGEMPGARLSLSAVLPAAR
jgi:hypothetical protein